MSFFTRIVSLLGVGGILLSPLLVQAQERSYPVPTAIIARGQVITPDILEMKEEAEGGRPLNADTLFFYDQIVGKQAKRTLMPNKPIGANDIAPLTLVKRNSQVNLIYRDGSMLLSAIGRALDDGGTGEMVRVMNLTSRKTVTGIILPTGEIDVSPQNNLEPAASSVAVPDLPESRATVR